MTSSSPATDVKRRAGWLPDDQDALEAWLAGHRERVEAKPESELHPVVQEFAELLERDPVLRMYAERMITEVPQSKAYSKRHLESVEQLLRLIDHVLTMA